MQQEILECLFLALYIVCVGEQNQSEQKRALDLRAAELRKSAEVNQQGATPMAVAQQNNQQQAVALLQRHGAK